MSETAKNESGPGGLSTSATSSSPSVAVTVLNWNAWSEVLTCAESVLASTYPSRQLILVDNGSTDESPDRLKAWAAHRFVMWEQDEGEFAGARFLVWKRPPRGATDLPGLETVALLFSKENTGYTGGVNLGIKWGLERDVPVEFICWAGADVRFLPTTLSSLVDAARASGAGLVGGTDLDPESGRVERICEPPYPVALAYFIGYLPGVRGLVSRLYARRSRRDASLPQGVRRSGRAWGAVLLACREMLEGVRARRGTYLNDGFFMYGDESDISWACREVGWQVAATDHAVFHHPLGVPKPPRVYYYSTRNALLLAHQIMPWYLRWPFYAVHGGSTLISAARQLLRGKVQVAKARWAGLKDGHRKVTGRWIEH
ncbi:MAG TPA: glycosyltransferase [Candidatus Thermoplasmatota archaeon]|nr:glycosyltransferase [Candidatus Thermoplasmatota archaeon]